MPLLMKGMRQYVKHLKQPFKCMVNCTLCGLITAFITFIIGIPLLVFFGSNLSQDEVMKRVPAWIGLIAAGTGVMCLLMAITLCVFLYRLFHQHQAAVNRMGETPPGNARQFAPDVYPVQHPASSGPLSLPISPSAPLIDEKQEEKITPKNSQPL
ncbi:uncharacterized protein LOC143244485 isoform X2 [Tachypleus tridentatus]|uniref:uncharacterized protein LOC143244485 isoform X2 n=1 Tax=Tachypleus tridentatus TaxID=6853 RepID=UPI003FD5D515